MAKKRFSFRFSTKTIELIDRGVARLKETMPWMDRTKFLEHLITKFSRKK